MTREQIFSLSNNQLPLWKKSSKSLSINQYTCLKNKLSGGLWPVLPHMSHTASHLLLSTREIYYTYTSKLQEDQKKKKKKAKFCSDLYKYINVDFDLPVLGLPLHFDFIFKFWCPWSSPVGVAFYDIIYKGIFMPWQVIHSHPPGRQMCLEQFYS